MAETISAYGWQTGDATPSAGYITPAVVAILRRYGVRRVLDLGCGNGALCAVLAKAGFDVQGAERDADGVALAAAANPGIRFHRQDIAEPPAVALREGGPFEAVVSTEVIEHLYSPHLLPQFAARLLEPGGLLVITTPYHGYLKNLALALAGKWDGHHTALWHGGHIKFWSRRTLTRLLEDAGYRVVAFQGVGRLPWLWKSMVLVARRN